MSDESVLAPVVEFVEGRMGGRDFERLLHSSRTLEGALVDDADHPAPPYIGRAGTYVYLLEQDYGDPGGVLNAQGALSDWLNRHGIAHEKSKNLEEHYDLLLAAQPKWLDVDVKYLEEQYVARAGGREGAALRDWLRQELLSAFRFVSAPPDWIQNPEWPIGPNGPLVFLGQLEVERYVHDAAAVYVFHDPKTGECETVIQVA